MLAEWEAGGARIVTVAQAASAGIGELERGSEPIVVVGDADDWQRQWQLLSAVRDDHALVIDPSVGADFRALSADRMLPPYCAPGRAGAWLCRDGLPPARIALPRPGGAEQAPPSRGERDRIVP